MIEIAPFQGRDNFAKFLNERSLVGTAVEIGTHRADFAVSFLHRWNGKRLYCIDPWIAGYNDNDPVSSSDRLEDYRIAMNLLLPYTTTERSNGRVKVLKLYSEQAAGRFKDGTFDFVYIDANHDPAFFAKDVNSWWSKIRSGGILAGHDFLNCEWGRGIQSILLPFIIQNNLDLYMVSEPDVNKPWSFYVFK